MTTAAAAIDIIIYFFFSNLVKQKYIFIQRIRGHFGASSYHILQWRSQRRGCLKPPIAIDIIFSL